jgi:hypothetical protein
MEAIEHRVLELTRAVIRMLQQEGFDGVSVQFVKSVFKQLLKKRSTGKLSKKDYISESLSGQSAIC